MTGVREWINQHPKVAVSMGGVIVVLAIGILVVEVMAGRHHYPAASPDSWFTVDDGKTYFAASSDNIAPFDYNGQQAVHAYVYRCGNQTFVGYMDRFTPRYHDMVVAHGLTPEAERWGRELKRPGESKWVQSGDLNLEAQYYNVKCPDGSNQEPEAIEP
jgi:hypothetical protein